MAFQIEENVLIKYTEEPYMTEVIIPDGVTEIGDEAFKNCKSVTSVSVPEGVIKIGKAAFYGCSALISIALPDSLMTIKERAFSECENLLAIALPCGVTEISDYIFDGCTALEKITLSDKISSVGKYAFYHTPWFKNHEGAFLVIGEGILINYKSYERDVIIPDNVKIIGRNAFERCVNIQSVTFSESVEIIDEYAFSRCTGIKFLTIPENIRRIKMGAFRGCAGLKKVTVSEGVTTIEAYAFEACSALESVTLPDSLKKISEGVFAGCIQLRSVKLPKDLTEIGTNAFFRCYSLKELDIPDSLTEIGRMAFAYCCDLTMFKAAEKINVVEENAFLNCEKLSAIVFGGGAAKIKSNSFSGCKELRSLVVPNMRISRFHDDFEMALITGFTENEDRYPADIKEDYLSYISRRGRAVAAYAIHNNNTELLHYLCKHKLIMIGDIEECTGLAANSGNVEISAMLLDYKNNAFTPEEVEREAQRKLEEELNYDPFSVAGIEKNWCYSKKADGGIRLDYYKGESSRIEIPVLVGEDVVTEIGDYALSPYRTGTTIEQRETLCDLEIITIPENIISIGANAFRGCRLLWSVAISDGVKSIGANAFCDCVSLRTVVIPPSATKIGKWVFNWSKNLVISAPKGSYAIEYAMRNKINYIEI